MLKLSAGNEIQRDHAAACAPFARPYVAYGIFLLCASLYLLPFMRIAYVVGTDEGTLLSGAVRVVQGQVFARDFFEVVGPGTFYWLAAFFKLFGVTFMASRICLFLTSLGTGLLMYFLSRRICGRYQSLPCILLAATYFGMLWPGISHHVDSNFFALLSFACIVWWQDRRSSVLLLTAGALAGATTCILQPKGALLLFALLVWLAIQRWRNSAPWSSMALVLAGYCSVIGAVGFYFWSQGALGSLIYVDYLFPSQHYSAVNAVPYAQGLIHNYWDHWVIAKRGFYWTVALAAILIVPLILTASLPILLPLLGTARGKKMMEPIILLYWLCGAALWVSEFHHRDINHLVMGSPLLLILWVHLLTEGRGNVPAYALQILAICGTCLAAFNLCVVLTAHSSQTRVGPVATFKADAALSYLEAHVRPGDAIFAYPYCPMYYFLSSTTNPTPFSVLIYNYNTPAQFREVIRDLDERGVRYVVWNTGFAQNGIPSYSPSMQWEKDARFIVEPYLVSHYNIAWGDANTLILERKRADDTR